MLKLEDFFHLPQVDTLVAQMIADGPGLAVVAGFDPRLPPELSASSGFLPSGRAAIFRILMREMLEAVPSAHCVVIARDREAIRVPRQLKRRVEIAAVEPPHAYTDRIWEAAARRPDLLVIDQLDLESAPPAFEAAARWGIKVFSQVETVFAGTQVARQFALDWGVSPDHLRHLAWVLAVQRLPALCPHCRRPAPPSDDQRASLRLLFPDLETLIAPQSPAGEALAFYRAAGCEHCQNSGRQGDAIVFDIFHADPDALNPFAQPSLLPAVEYLLRLAAQGILPLEDVLRFGSGQFHRTYNLLATSQRALADSNAALERKRAELEAANRVLQQRTRALVSFQGIGQALITSTDLDDLAARICRHTADLCGADRAILYLLRPPDQADVLAVVGWNPGLLHRSLDQAMVLRAGGASNEPKPFNQWPPGILARTPDVEGAALRAGLSVPLIAQNEQIGLLIVHSTQKARFAPGEVSLLQTFASQAALAIQRAGLIEKLRTKIALLEAAQAELAQKERIEHELELARQVQQSVLPRTFPQLAGYRFAAHNEPARQVGGDFYDVIQIDAETFGVAVADVSDKGMPSALYMALTRSLLRAEARRECSPREVLARVNKLLLELTEPNMFVTVFYGVVDCATRQMTYARAGHDRPLLLRGGVTQELGGQGTALGLFESSFLRLTEEQVDLAPGDRLVLYTDGLTDVLSPEGKPFERQALKDLLCACAALPLNLLCSAVFARLTAYQGSAEQYDDMTMLVLEVEA